MITEKLLLEDILQFCMQKAKYLASDDAIKSLAIFSKFLK